MMDNRRNHRRSRSRSRSRSPEGAGYGRRRIHGERGRRSDVWRYDPPVQDWGPPRWGPPSPPRPRDYTYGAPPPPGLRPWVPYQRRNRSHSPDARPPPPPPPPPFPPSHAESNNLHSRSRSNTPEPTSIIASKMAPSVSEDWTALIHTTTRHDRDVQQRLFARLGQSLVEGQDTTKCINTMLEQAKQRERFHLLEMAVWKFACCSDLPPHVKSLSAVVTWLEQGWKASAKRKQQFFRCNDVVIIMDRVAPFLQGESAAFSVCGSPAYSPTSPPYSPPSPSYSPSSPAYQLSVNNASP